MARINKISITLCALLFTTLSFTPMANASEQARHSAVQKTHLAKSTERKKKTTSKNEKKKTATHKQQTVSSKTSKPAAKKSRKTSRTASTLVTEKCTVRKGHKSNCLKVGKTAKLSEVHKVRVQKAQKTAMNKLMGQIGKPYRWGGTSPRTGFDCSGLVYYAYKDLVKFRIPRTANEMYHLRDAASVNRGELESGDLVFFRTQGRGTADHVGVYVGNGKFIQSPRSGQDIQITSLSEDYWVRHYVGARRVMTPKTIR
ncbi:MULTISPECIES: C40 family peptidase [Lelliottia]|uniref:C40 family peptidase n=1 Tax=Lelliottia amnigena TaxID=61646 RepID=A0AAP2ABC5_LELAM|nr:MULTISPECIES: C40 family peptidase [Lelliottia]ATG00870.1 endopeptidase [Lelliottia amnigena]MBL5898163.1 C40 family peptidase [Lelliottia amnigena]MBL5928956.1 C40 family peptidase [Lelliottia amnigena]MBL5934030.1 C40 family peptidase [Lelliottia amnigena]MBL5964964.1 C40 family peptidase [Lelliottia amnigena]